MEILMTVTKANWMCYFSSCHQMLWFHFVWRIRDVLCKAEPLPDLSSLLSPCYVRCASCGERGAKVSKLLKPDHSTWAQLCLGILDLNCISNHLQICSKSGPKVFFFSNLVTKCLVFSGNVGGKDSISVCLVIASKGQAEQDRGAHEL